MVTCDAEVEAAAAIQTEPKVMQKQQSSVKRSSMFHRLTTSTQGCRASGLMNEVEVSGSGEILRWRQRILSAEIAS